jgi:hypothetical protein
LAARNGETGVWRPKANAQKPAVGGLFCNSTAKFSNFRTVWLTWEDSNFHITIPKSAFEMSTEFPPIWRQIRPGDFCSSELQLNKGDTCRPD